MAKDEKSQGQKDEQTIRNLRADLLRLRQSAPEFTVGQIAELILEGRVFDHAFIQHSHTISEDVMGNDPTSPGSKTKTFVNKVDWRFYARRRQDGHLIDRHGPELRDVINEVLTEFGLKYPEGLEPLLKRIEKP